MKCNILKIATMAYITFAFGLHDANAVTVCGRGYIKTVSLHQGTNQSQVRDKRNLAVEFDSTGFKISDLPASSNYWQPGNHRFLTADLIGLNQMDEYKNDSLYKEFYKR